jgi:pyruvate/2-oxoglutarate dehydrogenase complex dihydrolipoamide acyltransferase (E2) component
MKFLDAKRSRATIDDKMSRVPIADKSDRSTGAIPPAGSGHPAGKHPALDREPNATQAANRLANDSGIDLGKIQGTGIEGRITVGDVQAAIDASKPKSEGPPVSNLNPDPDSTE